MFGGPKSTPAPAGVQVSTSLRKLRSVPLRMVTLVLDESDTGALLTIVDRVHPLL